MMIILTPMTYTIHIDNQVFRTNDRLETQKGNYSSRLNSGVMLLSIFSPWPRKRGIEEYESRNVNQTQKNVF